MSKYVSNRTLILIGVLVIALLNSTIFGVSAMSQSIKEIDLTIDNKRETVETRSTTIKSLLNEVDHVYKSTDKINHELSDRITDEMEVVVKTEKSVHFSERGDNKYVKTHATTVEEFLDENNIRLTKSDSVIPSLESAIEDGDKIVVIYEKTEEYVKEELIDYEVEEELSFDIPYGEKEVVVKGEKGLLKKTYETQVRNDITLSDKLISEEVIVRPINEKVLIGTKEIVENEIKNKTIERENSNMYKGETKVIKEGSNGIVQLVYENDNESRTLAFERHIKDPVDKVIEKGTKERPNVEVTSKYSLSELQYHGVIRSDGRKYTYYSEQVLPGHGLKIPGRHINTGGYVADKDGFIVLASNISIPKGTVINTPFGYKGKVYDVCESCTRDWFDVYTK